jgi:hypothetical protein
MLNTLDSDKNISIPDLTRKLTDPFNDDLLKVRSVFSWLASNISYDSQGIGINPGQMHHPRRKSSMRLSGSGREIAGVIPISSGTCWVCRGSGAGLSLDIPELTLIALHLKNLIMCGIQPG